MAADPGWAARWDEAYAQGDTRCSWFQDASEMSLRMLDAAGITPADSVIDVGGGASPLAGELLERSFRDVTVLDISAAAMEQARHRLGPRAGEVHWLTADIRAWRPHRRYAAWHDRAVFHFLTAEPDRRDYRRALAEAAGALLRRLGRPPRRAGIPSRRHGHLRRAHGRRGTRHADPPGGPVDAHLHPQAGAPAREGLAGRLRIELRADGAGTLLTLTDTFDELGKAARDGAGWHECLDRLVAALDGTPQRPMGELWVEVHPCYVTHLGPDAATIGPPPGNDPRRAQRGSSGANA